MHSIIVFGYRQATLRRSSKCRRETEDYEWRASSLRGALATKQSSFLLRRAKTGLLRFARNDGITSVPHTQSSSAKADDPIFREAGDIEPRRRGVLDRPLKPDDDSLIWGQPPSPASIP
jgi:hypothetical protein